MTTVLDELIVRIGPEFVGKADLRRLENMIAGLQRKLNAASKAFTIAGAALTGALFGAGRKIYDFETEMNRLQRDTNATEEQFDALREQAIRLGSSLDYTTISVGDAVVAQRELVKTGLTIEQAMVALPGVLNLVAATEMEVGQAAEKTAKLIKGYGLEVSDIPRVHDLIAYSAVNMGITAEQLINSLLRVGPTARLAGLQFETVVASLSLLVDQGMIAERGATAFERVLTQLSKADVLPPAAVKAIEGLGLTIDFVKKKFDEGDIIGLMSTMARHGLDLASSSQIFGEEGSRAANVMAQNSRQLREFDATLVDSEGHMKRQADIMNRGFPGAVNALKSASETAIIALGDAGLTGHLKKMAEAASEAVQWFQDLSSETKALVASSLALGPALLAVGAALKVVSIALGGLVPAAAAVGAVARIFTSAGLVALFGKIGTAARLMWLSIGGPVGIAVGAAAMLIYIAWKPISTFFEGLWESLTSGASRVSAAFGRLLDALGPTGESIRMVFMSIGAAWNWMKNLFTGDGTQVGKGWGAAIIDDAVAMINVLTAIVGFITRLGRGWGESISRDFRLIGDAWVWLTGLFTGVGDGIRSAADSVSEALSGIWDSIKEWFAGLSLFGMGVALLQTFADGIKSYADTVLGVLSGFWDKARAVLPFVDAPPDEGAGAGVEEKDSIWDRARALLPFVDAPDEGANDNTPLVIPNLDLGAINMNLPVGPSPAAAPAGAGASLSVTQTFGQGAIQINVPGGDAREIAGTLEQAVRDHWRASAEQMDSRQLA